MVRLFRYAKSLAGQELARWRRRRAFPTRCEYLPPQLRKHPDSRDFAADGSLAATLPVSLYWGMERNVDLDGVRPPGIPRWLGFFDWVVGFEYGWADTGQFPESVFCEPRYVPELLAFLSKTWPSPPKSKSLLAITIGPDYLLSWQRKKLIRQCGDYFACIFYEAKDVDLDHVQTLPMGLTEHYSRSNADYVLALAQGLSRQPPTPSEELSVLAAWGAWWPGLDDLIPDRQEARAFAASSDLVTTGQFPSNEWFDALTTYDFMMCPLGNGIQASKMIEALLMGCIPIATRHPTFVELYERGMPMLLVNEWTDLNENRLREAHEKLFPRVMEFRETLLNLEKWWEFSFPCHTHAHSGASNGAVSPETPR